MKETREQRSRIMRAVRSRDTTPELNLRRMLRELGHCGYRLHRSDLPGTPDIAFIGRRKVIFVHGCFWHGHDCSRGKREPRANATYWRDKIMGNRRRDHAHMAALSRMGWRVLIVWECETRDERKTKRRLARFLHE